MGIKPDKFLLTIIMDALDNAIRYWNHQGVATKHIPHQSTRLNEERWEDELSTERYHRGLLLYGKVGNGKTYLSFAISNALYKQDKAVMAISISKLLAIVKDSFDRHGDFSETDVLSQLACS